MDINRTISALAALAQSSRLGVFRMLMREGPEGLPAGEIARRLDIPHNTLSSHLNILARAGLVEARRDGRSIIYSVELDTVRDVLAYLIEDCCRGRPEVCAPLIDAAMAECRPQEEKSRPRKGVAR